MVYKNHLYAPMCFCISHFFFLICSSGWYSCDS